MAKSAVDDLVTKIDADIAKLQAMRAYVTENAVEGTEPSAPKVRKPRKPRGLPASDPTF